MEDFFDRPLVRAQGKSPPFHPNDLFGSYPLSGAGEGHIADYLRTRAAAVSGSAIDVRRCERLDHYAAMSALQKAVRAGCFSLALGASLQLLRSGNAAANWRRLRVIAVEDIGVGDPESAALVLWLAQADEFRQTVGEEIASAVAVDLLCRATKSRDMCDVAAWSGLPGAIDGKLPKLLQEDASRLVHMAADPNATFRLRHAAARALFPARFDGFVRWPKRSPEHRLDLYERLGLPPALIFAIETDASYKGDALTSAGPIVWAVMSATHTTAANIDVMDRIDLPIMAGALASTFDRHTRVGTKVIGQLLREHEPLREFFASHPQADPMPCLLRALFYVEGAVLKPRLTFEGSLDLYWSVLDAKFASTGIPSLRDGGFELLDLVRDALPEVNELRAMYLR